jgi:TRAP-type transport system periplasmic protein
VRSNKLFWVKIAVTVMLIIGSFSMLACGSQPAQPASSAPAAASPTQTANTSTAPAAPPASEVIKLKLSSPYFENTSPSKYATHIADLVEQKTNGRVKIERFYGATLASPGEHFQLLSSGAVDIIALHVGTNGALIPLNNIYVANMALGREGTLTFINKYRELPEVKAIMLEEQKQKNVKIFPFNEAGVSGIVTKDAISALSDLKGKKVNLMTPVLKQAMEAYGMIPVNITLPEVNEGISRGLVDAGFGAISSTLDMKWFEVSKTYLFLDAWTAEIPIAMNLKRYDSLPPDVQQSFIDAANETVQWSIQLDKENTEKALQTFEKAGCKVVIVSPTDAKSFSETSMKTRLGDLQKAADTAGVGDKAKTLIDIFNNMYSTASK